MTAATSLCGVSVVHPGLPAAAQENVDVGKLPVNLERIQRQLQQATVRENQDGLNLRYVVDVYGQAPRIELCSGTEPDDWSAAVRRTHPPPDDRADHAAGIRAPAADFSSLFRWLADKAKDKK